ncbi:3-deoxy-D-manno-octulosonic acid transferase [Amylibacter sp.]|nr:3-deoxy-D-manno-octulosonic acid transferase [Amylibacter sp.]
MRNFSLGILINYVLAYLWQPIEKSKLLQSLEKDIISKELFNQLQGITHQNNKTKTLIWLHAKTLLIAENFSEIISHFENKKDIQFLLTTERSELDKEFTLPGIHQVIPLDHPSFVNQFIKYWKPDSLVWLSDTIRPILLHKVSKSNIPAIYANASLTSKKTKTFLPFRAFIKVYLSYFDRILAKSDDAAKDLRRLKGVRSKLEVLGIMQTSARALPYDEGLRSKFSVIQDNRFLWFAAHVVPGEIAALGKAQRRVSRNLQGLLLILHMDDAEQAKVAKTKLSALSLKVELHKEDIIPDLNTDILIVSGSDNLGMWFRLASVCFLGGSLVQIGGADPFEAAALGSAILHGPFTQNYQNDYDRLLDAGGARLVYNSEMLSNALVDTMSPDQAALMAHAAWEVCSAGAEVNDRIIELLNGYLDKEKSFESPA